MDNLQTASKESAAKQVRIAGRNGRRGQRADGDRSQHDIRADQTRLAKGQAVATAEVYDVLDAGPRNRFVVRGTDGPVIVHNCQALAGEICKLAISEIETAGFRAVAAIHDEIICVVGEDEAEEAGAVMRQAMSESPSWFKNLKLDCEVGVGRSWREAKP